MADQGITRRGFVGAVGATAGATALIGAATRPTRAAAVGANDRIRLGIIGAGGRGKDLMGSFLAMPEVDFLAVADVDDRHAEEAAAKVEDARKTRPWTGRDYRELLDRKDIDAVVIATPDHWHAAPAILACQAGKDVYVEKPVAHNIAEGQAMLKAARKYDKVMAVGTQQRSAANFQQAVDIVKSGKLGKVFWVQTWNFENISPLGMGPDPESDAPSHVDYDRWLGAAPKRPFTVNRFHFLFRWFFDYAGGMMSDWGVHLNDIVLWALDAPGPKSVAASGGVLTTDDDRDTPDTLQVVYDFPGCVLTYSMRKGNSLPFNQHGYGILFCGTNGSLLIDRAGYEIIPDTIAEPYGIRLAKGKQETRTIDLKPDTFKAKDDGMAQHAANFLECLRSRQKPVADIEIGHRSTITTHLGNIAYKLGRKLTWDTTAENFGDDKEANALLTRLYRPGYELPQV